MNPALEAIKEKEAKEFCKDWPNGQPCHRFDMELFFERGFSACHSHMQKDNVAELLLIDCDEMRKLNTALQKEIAERDTKIKEVLEYCNNQTQFMWAARIVSILLGCDFRDSGEKVKEFINHPSDGGK